MTASRNEVWIARNAIEMLMGNADPTAWDADLATAALLARRFAPDLLPAVEERIADWAARHPARDYQPWTALLDDRVSPT
jgi:hypothetical protein